ncbi:hypothetical protein ABPG75_009487 [Micractinium tetrahymenae]
MGDRPAGGGPGTPPALPTTPPAEEWQASWAATLPELARITRRVKHAAATGSAADVAIMRSSQLDAARLDDELTGMLREQFLSAFALFRPAAVARLQPELTLLLDLLIFRFSIWEGRPLPGMALMNLRYRNEAAVQRQRHQTLAAAAVAAAAGGGGARPGSSAGISSSGGGGSSSSRVASTEQQQLAGGRSGVEGPGLSPPQRWLYCACAVLLRYAWARLGHHAAASHWADEAGWARGGWRRRCWGLMQHAESAYRLASLANFLAFLRTGRYMSLLERLLRARLVYHQPSAARAISFEYLNRQLVWSELSELLLFLLPLVNVKAIKHALRSHLPRLPILSAAAGGAGAGAAAAAAAGSAGQRAGEQSQEPCPVCSAAEVLNPWAAEPCGHVFCYYCLRSHCLADPQYSCPLCLRRVAAMRPAVARCGEACEDEPASSQPGSSGSAGGS